MLVHPLGAGRSPTDELGKKRRMTQFILRPQFDVPDGVTIPGIEIYHAVFTGGVRTYKELEEWRKTNQLADSLGWLP